MKRGRAERLVIRDVWESHSNRNNLIGDSILLVILYMINPRDCVGGEFGKGKGAEKCRMVTKAIEFIIGSECNRFCASEANFQPLVYELIMQIL